MVRNRLKRIVREWFRRSFPDRENPWEIVVIARPGAGSLEAREIGEELSGAVAGLRAPGEAPR